MTMNQSKSGKVLHGFSPLRGLSGDFTDWLGQQSVETQDLYYSYQAANPSDKVSASVFDFKRIPTAAWIAMGLIGAFVFLPKRR